MVSSDKGKPTCDQFKQQQTQLVDIAPWPNRATPNIFRWSVARIKVPDIVSPLTIDIAKYIEEGAQTDIIKLHAICHRYSIHGDQLRAQVYTHYPLLMQYLQPLRHLSREIKGSQQIDILVVQDMTQRDAAWRVRSNVGTRPISAPVIDPYYMGR